MRSRKWLLSTATTSFLFSALAINAQATLITFDTPSGASTGGQPVDATATFTTSAGQVSITLVNLEANPTSVVQCISDLEFTLSPVDTSATIFSETGTPITVNSGGTFTDGSPTSFDWPLTTSGNQLHLDDLTAGGEGPAALIIGPPAEPSNLYSAAGGSIAGNGPHNPFMIGNSVTIVLTAPGVTSSSTVTAASFSFGTTDGTNVVTGMMDAPEPAGLTSGLIGFLAIGLLACGARCWQVAAL